MLSLASVSRGSTDITDKAELERRRERPVLDVARALAGEYGAVLEPINYVRGVAMSGRLRLAGIDPEYRSPAADLRAAVDGLITDETFALMEQSDGSVHAGLVWCAELSDAPGGERYGEFLVRVADLYLASRDDGFPVPVDPDYRVEDVFFVGAVLGRAFALTGDERYADVMASVLGRVNAQADTGLWWHCGASPFYWGRGNAFVALGFAEALSYLSSDHQARTALEEKHRAHLRALLGYQDESGAWRQVIDRPDAYLELTATAMIGYSLARGIGRGWLDGEFRGAADRAWGAVSERVDDGGMVFDSCTGTGPLPSLEDYLTRATENGHDDRGGSMALWFATEYAALEQART
ncbi:MAG: glycoside hydrolase family 88 protein [Chloroflexi bacterium]|nr:glycoside hydrolase family 88 protein [Chloroflexota bacterium]